MRIVFMGTPDFAAEHLETIIDKGYQVVGVFSQEDKPRGRGRVLAPTPVKEVALKAGIPVFQPKSVNKGEGFASLEALKPDIIITVAYGKLLKRKVIDLPVNGCYNVHASLLPMYRGAAPIQRTLENGETKTGITIFKIDEGMDTGPIVMMKSFPIEKEDTFGTVFQKLSELGQKVLLEFLELAKNKEITLSPQPTDGSYAPKVSKEDLLLGEFDDCIRVYNKIRAYDPLPGVFTTYEGKRIKLFGAIPVELDHNDIPGQIISIGKISMIVACEKGAVKILRVQFPGKKVNTVWEARSGRLLEKGMILGR